MITLVIADQWTFNWEIKQFGHKVTTLPTFILHDVRKEELVLLDLKKERGGLTVQAVETLVEDFLNQRPGLARLSLRDMGQQKHDEL